MNWEDQDIDQQQSDDVIRIDTAIAIAKNHLDGDKTINSDEDIIVGEYQINNLKKVTIEELPDLKQWMRFIHNGNMIKIVDNIQYDHILYQYMNDITRFGQKKYSTYWTERERYRIEKKSR